MNAANVPFQSLETELQNSPSEAVLDILKKVIFDGRTLGFTVYPLFLGVVRPII